MAKEKKFVIPVIDDDITEPEDIDYWGYGEINAPSPKDAFIETIEDMTDEELLDFLDGDKKLFKRAKKLLDSKNDSKLK